MMKKKFKKDNSDFAKNMMLTSVWMLAGIIVYLAFTLTGYLLHWYSYNTASILASAAGTIGTLFLALVASALTFINSRKIVAGIKQARYDDVKIRTAPVFSVDSLLLVKSQKEHNLQSDSDDYLLLENEPVPKKDFLIERSIGLILSINERETSFINGVNFQKLVFTFEDGTRISFTNPFEGPSKIKSGTGEGLHIQKSLVFGRQEKVMAESVWNQLASAKKFKISTNYVVGNSFGIRRKGKLTLFVERRGIVRGYDGIEQLAFFAGTKGFPAVAAENAKAMREGTLISVDESAIID